MDCARIMKPRQAKELILHEAQDEDGVVVSLRLGRDPGSARMRELIGALPVLFKTLAGRERIERELAAALFTLGTEVPAQIESWTCNGCKWREDLVHRELPSLLLGVESVFEGEWLGGSSADLLESPISGATPTITVENRRKKRSTLEAASSGALILDLTSKGDEPWVRFSPFYPHGGIPVPNAPGVFAQSVEGLWQGLKVFDREDIDRSSWEKTGMRGIKRGGLKRGKVLGHRFGPESAVLLGYREARYKIYLPAYRWVLEHRLVAEVSRLRLEWANRPLVLLDYETNNNPDDLPRPLSHASLVKAFLEGAWPNVPEQID